MSKAMETMWNYIQSIHPNAIIDRVYSWGEILFYTDETAQINDNVCSCVENGNNQYVIRTQF